MFREVRKALDGGGGLEGGSLVVFITKFRIRLLVLQAGSGHINQGLHAVLIFRPLPKGELWALAQASP